MGSDRDVGRFDRWAAGYDRDPLQERFFGPEAGLRVSDWVPIFDLDVLLPLRARRHRPPTGRMPLVTAAVARGQP